MKKFLVYILVIAIAIASLISLAACNDKGDGEFKIGVIHIADPAHPGYSQAHDKGIVAMQKELELKDSQIIRKNMVADDDAAATKVAIEDCIAEGAKFIIGTSFAYGPTMVEMAIEYPNVIFAHGSGFLDEPDNLNVYFGRIYQARYLSGIVAGLKTKTNKLGYVSAFGTDIAETCSGINAFALGAASVNSAATVDVRILNSWYDPANEEAAADALIEAGCDVIAQHCDTSNPQIAAEKAGNEVFGIGYNTDMTPDAPSSHLTATVWDWGVYYKEATKVAMKCFEGGTFDVTPWKEYGNYYGKNDIGTGFVGLSPFNEDIIEEDTIEIINFAKGLMEGGKWDVFSGYALSFVKGEITDDFTWQISIKEKALMTNKGTVIVDAGGTPVKDDVIQVSMNYFVYNVNSEAVEDDGDGDGDGGAIG